MTRNRTAIDLIYAVGAGFLVILLLVLASGLAISRYFSVARDSMRRVDVRLRKRAARRAAA